MLLSSSPDYALIRLMLPACVRQYGSPLQGGALVQRRLGAFGMSAHKEADQGVDVLADKGDILHEVTVTIWLSPSNFGSLHLSVKAVRRPQGRSSQ